MSVAIYVSTMRADYSLAKALIASIEEHLPSPRIYVIPDDDHTDPLKWVALHWAGCPRPGPLPLPGRAVCAAQWRKSHRRFCRLHGDWSGYLGDCLKDARTLAWQAGSRLKRRFVP